MKIGVYLYWASWKYKDKYLGFNSYEEMFNYLRKLYDTFVIHFLSVKDSWDRDDIEDIIKHIGECFEYIRVIVYDDYIE